MVAGHLRIKDGNYHIVLSYNDENGKRKSTCRSTHLPVRGNKKRAEAMLQEARREMEETLRCQELAKRQDKSPDRKPIFFTDFMNEWLSMMKPSLEATTYSSYQNSIQKQIIPSFEKRYPKLLLQDLTARHIQEYYSYELEERKCSTNTVIHRHTNIRKALQYAFKTDLIDCNLADKIQRPRKNRHEVVPYNAQELAQLFEAVKGNLLELGVLLAAFYGLRREEVLGLKWDAIDFKKKTITIRHTVTEANIDGKHTIIEKDRTKTKSSHRTLPLVESFEKFLRELKKKQAENQRLCGSCYCQDYLDYIYLNELGERVKPNWLTTAFPAFLEKHGMRRIRFHDLRHSCASLLYTNGVALKDIQEWLGHSDIGTTSNIYTHLDYSSKLASAQAIEGILPGFD